MFIGLDLLLSSTREQRMECAFEMMDGNQSGRVSQQEIEVFIRTIAPPTTDRRMISPLAARIMSEADVNRSGMVTFSEFMQWPGKSEVLAWLDQFHSRVLSRWDGGVVSAPVAVSEPDPWYKRSMPAPSTRYPWEGITTSDLVRVFRSESWAGTLVPSEFAHVLDKLGLDGRSVGPKLFSAFDTDNSGQLDFKEMFIGLALLLSSSREQQLNCAFDMMDGNQSGRVSREEFGVFLSWIAPTGLTRYEVLRVAADIFRAVDTNYSGLITFNEFISWQGKQQILDWLDGYRQRILSRFDADIPRMLLPLSSRAFLP
jgi:Ca2+-binding EF-hand superfamily protein